MKITPIISFIKILKYHFQQKYKPYYREHFKMNGILETSNYKLSKRDEQSIIDDINLLLKQYENILKTSDSNNKKILNGSMICEYMLQLLLQKKGFLVRDDASLNEIVEFSKENRILPDPCCSFLNSIDLYRKNKDIDFPDDLTGSFLKAFAYYITWFDNTYSKEDLFNVKNCFDIINSQSDSKLFCIDDAVKENRVIHDDFADIDAENLMLCPSCGSEIEKDVNFCPHCRHKFIKKEESITKKIKKTISKPQEVEVQKLQKTKTHLNNALMETMGENLILEMLDEQNEAIKAIMETVLETLTIVENIDAKLDIISDNLNIIQSHSKKLIEAAWSEEEIDRIIEVHTTQCVENILEYKKEISKDDQFRSEEIKLIDTFSQKTWDKLSDDSKTCLITAKFMYNKFITMEEVIDYSGVCILLTKALEIEIFKRFFTNFIEFLDERYNKDYTQYPTALLYNENAPLRPQRFTMGKIAFVLCKKKDWNDSDEQNQNNKEKLLEYCRERIFSNKSTKEIERLLDSYASSIEMIKDKYRNPSAHRNHVQRKTAKDCFDLIVDVYKLLKEMLDSFDA